MTRGVPSFWIFACQFLKDKSFQVLLSVVRMNNKIIWLIGGTAAQLTEFAQDTEILHCCSCSCTPTASTNIVASAVKTASRPGEGPRVTPNSSSYRDKPSRIWKDPSVFVGIAENLPAKRRKILISHKNIPLL